MVVIKSALNIQNVHRESFKMSIYYTEFIIKHCNIIQCYSYRNRFDSLSETET